MDSGTNFKVVATSGCSFSDTQNWRSYKTWPKQLADQLNIKDWFNEGRGGQSNNLIRMRIIYRVSELLKTYKPEDILVGVMWSGPDRVGIHFDKNILNEDKTGKVWVDAYNFIPESLDTVWKPLLLSHEGVLQKQYYKYFHNPIGGVISTLHDILYTQKFLESAGVKYFMTNAWNIFEFKWDHWGQYKGTSETKNQNIGSHPDLAKPDLKWISDLIEWSKFIPVEGEWEWISQLNPNRDYIKEHHPSEEEHYEFTKQIIIPFLNEL
jgi:hypothetical protein